MAHHSMGRTIPLSSHQAVLCALLVICTAVPESSAGRLGSLHHDHARPGAAPGNASGNEATPHSISLSHRLACQRQWLLVKGGLRQLTVAAGGIGVNGRRRKWPGWTRRQLTDEDPPLAPTTIITSPGAMQTPRPGNDTAPASAFLRKDECTSHAGFQTPFGTGVFRIVGSNVLPITDSLREVVLHAFQEKYSPYHPELTVTLSEIVPLKVKVLPPSRAGTPFPATSAPTPTPNVKSSAAQGVDPSNPSNVQASTPDALTSAAIKQYLTKNAIEASVQIGLTRNSTYPHQDAVTGTVIGAELAAELASHGYSAQMFQVEAKPTDNAKIIWSRIPGYVYSNVSTFSLVVKVLSPHGSVLTETPAAVSQSGQLALIASLIPRLFNINIAEVGVAADNTTTEVTYIIITTHPHGTYRPAELEALVLPPISNVVSAVETNSSVSATAVLLPLLRDPSVNATAANLTVTCTPIVTSSDSSGRGGNGNPLSGGALAGIIIAVFLVAGACTAMAASLALSMRRQELRRNNTSGGWGGLDAKLQGYVVAPQDVQICKRPDGSDWLLGEGSFGRVYKGLRGGVQDIAVKQLLHTSTEESQIKAFMTEVGLLKGLNYDKNIVQFYGVCLQEDAQPMLICELMQGGNVATAISQGDPRLAWHHMGHRIALDIARGLYFLHSQNVLHGDIKSQNVLLTTSWDAKLGDVGLARLCTTDEESIKGAAATLGWTFAYAAPEVLFGEHLQLASDVYSFGVLLQEIVVAETPWSRSRLPPPQVPEQCPQVVWDLILECTSADPAARPAAKEIFDILRESAENDASITTTTSDRTSTVQFSPSTSAANSSVSTTTPSAPPPQMPPNGESTARPPGGFSFDQTFNESSKSLDMEDSALDRHFSDAFAEVVDIVDGLGTVEEAPAPPWSEAPATAAPGLLKSSGNGSSGGGSGGGVGNGSGINGGATGRAAKEKLGTPKQCLTPQVSNKLLASDDSHAAGQPVPAAAVPVLAAAARQLQKLHAELLQLGSAQTAEKTGRGITVGTPGGTSAEGASPGEGEAAVPGRITAAVAYLQQLLAEELAAEATAVSSPPPPPQTPFSQAALSSPKPPPPSPPPRPPATEELSVAAAVAAIEAPSTASGASDVSRGILFPTQSCNPYQRHYGGTTRMSSPFAAMEDRNDAPLPSWDWFTASAHGFESSRRKPFLESFRLTRSRASLDEHSPSRFSARGGDDHCRSSLTSSISATPHGYDQPRRLSLNSSPILRISLPPPTGDHKPPPNPFMEAPKGRSSEFQRQEPPGWVRPGGDAPNPFFQPPAQHSAASSPRQAPKPFCESPSAQSSRQQGLPTPPNPFLQPPQG